MFTPTEIEALPSAMEQLYRSLQLNIMSDLTERLETNGKEITSAADWQINRLYALLTTDLCRLQAVRLTITQSATKRVKL